MASCLAEKRGVSPPTGQRERDKGYARVREKVLDTTPPALASKAEWCSEGG